jgi:hypothetical protein
LSQSDVVTNLRTRVVVKLVSLLLVAYSTSAYSQDQAMTASDKKKFDLITGIENSGVINGPQYKMQFRGASSNPFFGPGEVKGIVRYNEEVFYVTLLYDIYKDEIIVKHVNASAATWFIQLDKNLVQEFVIDGHMFKNFNGRFHDVLFEGDNLLLVSKRAKLDRARDQIINYFENDEFFIVDGTRWNRIANISTFEKILKSKEDKKQLRLFVKQNNIKVKKFRDEDLIRVATFVNELRTKSQL